MNRPESLIRGRRGQNTVEYLLMLTVVVGVVLVSGTLLKKYMPGLLNQIETAISSAGNGLGGN